MLKFFRKYNKYILSIGVVVLMVAFLIEPALRMIGNRSGPADAGMINGQPVAPQQLLQADRELRILSGISPVLIPLSFNNVTKDNALRWLMFTRDAEAMGLWASDGQVNDLLPILDEILKTSGVMDVNLSQRAARTGEDPRLVHEALRHWLMYQEYWAMVNGQRHQSWIERIKLMMQGKNLDQIGYAGQAQWHYEMAVGAVRVSEPLRIQFLDQQFTQVRITAFPIDAKQYFQKVTVVEESELIAHFERFKNDLPGQGMPYGFGYRFPDRVKIEYLAIPLERVRQAVRIEEAEALRYYDSHLDEFKTVAASPGGVAGSDTDGQAGEGAGGGRVYQTYSQARERVVGRLKDVKAGELMQRMVKSARAMLRQGAEKLPEEGGYVVFPSGWQADLTIEEAAVRLQKEFGVLPDVHRLADRDLAVAELVALPGIGTSRIDDQRGGPFFAYALSAKELRDARDSKDNNPMAAYRLQVHLPSLPVIGADQTRYLFRLIEASPSRVPESIDEVRDRVVEDVKRLKAFDLVKLDAEMWRKRVVDGTLEEVAASLGQPLIRATFPRTVTQRGGWGISSQTPNVEGVGRDQEFVDAVFELAEQVSVLGGVSAVPVDQRLVAVAVEGKQRLVLVQLEEVIAVPQSEIEGIWKDPSETAALDTLIGQSLEAGVLGDAVSLEAMGSRVGFEAVKKRRDDKAPPLPESEPADASPLSPLRPM